MEYHDEPLQFISSHYFEIKNKDDRIYNAVKGIMTALMYLSYVMIPLISCLTIKYIYPTISCYVAQYSKVDRKDFSSHINEQFA